MKKLFTILALALATITASAQTDVPNRMLIKQGNEQNPTIKAFAINKVQEVNFARVDGEIKATIAFDSYVKKDDGQDMLKLAITRSESCESYCIDVLPANLAKLYDDDTMAKYFEQKNAKKMYEDFTSGELTGIELKGNTNYTVITLGYDQYGVPGETSRADFTTPKEQTVGTPSVTCNFDEITGTSFTVTVTPNADCGEYFLVQLGRGELEKQFEEWGARMGYANIGDMIKGFAWYGHNEVYTQTFGDLLPCTDYDLIILPTDVNGTYGDIITVPVTTAKQGGDGVAEMTITYQEVGGDAENGYYLPVTYTPNDQTSIHHDLLIEKNFFNQNYTDESLAALMKSDTNPFNPYDTYWNAIGVKNEKWNCTPGETYYAVSIAKNANGEYGPFAKVEIVTAPKNASAKVAKAENGVANRIAKAAKAKAGVAPVFKGGIQLKNVK
ncbi:hypothetical protein [Prevotella sp.]|uniref:hypothetical protein n=1 Tax=Prevotella sp. TaxID=59823 RepID=UPI003F7E6443